MFISLVGCKSTTTNNSEERFVKIYEQGSTGMNYLCIYEDKETGKKYLWKKAANAGGLCELD